QTYLSNLDRQRCVREKNCDHTKRNQQFANHGTKVSEQAAPASATGVDHSFTGNEFTDERSDDWSKEQAEDAKEQANYSTDDRAERAPLCCTEIFCAEITPEEIKSVGGKREQEQECDDAPADAFLRA